MLAFAPERTWKPADIAEPGAGLTLLVRFRQLKSYGSEFVPQSGGTGLVCPGEMPPR